MLVSKDKNKSHHFGLAFFSVSKLPLQLLMLRRAVAPSRLLCLPSALPSQLFGRVENGQSVPRDKPIWTATHPVVESTWTLSHPG